MHKGPKDNSLGTYIESFIIIVLIKCTKPVWRHFQCSLFFFYIQLVNKFYCVHLAIPLALTSIFFTATLVVLLQTPTVFFKNNVLTYK